MPEFQQSWRDWAAANFPESSHYGPDKTDKSPSDSFVRPIAPLPAEDNSKDSLAQSLSCLVADCRFTGYVVDLGEGLTTILCAPHRRELFQRSRQLVDAAEGGASSLFEELPCRACGRPVAPEDDPCKECVAAGSPLVQTALRLGALPLCSCGAVVSQPGEHCGHCLSKQAEGGGGTDDGPA